MKLNTVYCIYYDSYNMKSSCFFERRKNILTFFLFLILLLSVNLTYSQTVIEEAKNQKFFQNDICVPSTLYMLEGIQNDIFIEPFIKRWKPYDDVVRFSGTSKYSRRLQRVASIIEPVEGSTVQLDLVNVDFFDTIKTLTSTVKIGKPGIGDAPVTVSIIGDSYTQGEFFKNALLVKNYVPDIKLIGLRDIKGYEGQFSEGRGGWTLDRYFTLTKNRTDAYNGFWQPEGNFRYWGSTQYWKLANEYRIDPDKGWTFEESYNVSQFITQSLRFDTKSGLKKEAEKNDVMFDNDKNCFICYDGKKWKKVSDDFVWSFNYGKYLEMWDLDAPSILAEFLGLNDFRYYPDPAGLNFDKWNKQMEELITSYLNAVPDGKFVLMIPCSTCGIPDNEAGDFNIKLNACMWELRRNIIENFDKRETENIYIVDAAIAIDNVNGYNFTTNSVFTKPYPEYPGDKIIPVQKGNPHPFINYPTMGISLAAFIQHYR